MGRAKQTLPYGSSTILGTVIETLGASEVSGVTVVLGRNWQEVYASVQHLDAEIVVNPRPESGMLSSVKWGLAHLRNDAEAFLFVLGDQPQLTRELVNGLIESASESERAIAIQTWRGKRGHPLLVKSKLKRAVLELSDSGGLNQLMEHYAGEILEVPADSESVLEDIDTPEDYQRMRVES